MWWLVLILIVMAGGGAAIAETVNNSAAAGTLDAPTDGNSSDASIFTGSENMYTDPIASVASKAGFSGDSLLTAVAIALAESGGNPKAYNPEIAAGTPTGKGSFGLWQIYEKAHPEFASWNLFDPMQNAVAAFRVYSAAGNSFHPWSTYTSGAYAAKLDDASARLDTAALGATNV